MSFEMRLLKFSTQWHHVLRSWCFGNVRIRLQAGKFFDSKCFLCGFMWSAETHFVVFLNYQSLKISNLKLAIQISHFFAFEVHSLGRWIIILQLVP